MRRTIYPRRPGQPLHSKEVSSPKTDGLGSVAVAGSQAVSLNPLLMVLVTDVSRHLVGTIAQQAFLRCHLY